MSLALFVVQISCGRCVWGIGILRLRFCFVVREAKSSLRMTNFGGPAFFSTFGLVLSLHFKYALTSEIKSSSNSFGESGRV